MHKEISLLIFFIQKQSNSIRVYTEIHDLLVSDSEEDNVHKIRTTTNHDFQDYICNMQ